MSQQNEQQTQSSSPSSSSQSTPHRHQRPHHQKQTSPYSSTVSTATLQSFPQPAFQTQKALQLALQSHPYRVLTPEGEREEALAMASNSAQGVPTYLNFITGNKNKLAEVQTILEGVIELRNKNVDLVEIQGTIEEVTKDKCQRAAEAIQGPVLVEDTCLVFRAMNDLPGPYIKWFMQSLGAVNMHKMLAGFEDKSAQAVCTFGYSAGPGSEVILFQGRTDGKLVESRGSTVFGWDSCFEYEGQTYAEMEKSEKNKISHRGKALEKLKEWLASHAKGEAGDA